LTLQLNRYKGIVKTERSGFTAHFRVSTERLCKVSVHEIHVYVSGDVDASLGGRESPSPWMHAPRHFGLTKRRFVSSRASTSEVRCLPAPMRRLLLCHGTSRFRYIEA